MPNDKKRIKDAALVLFNQKGLIDTNLEDLKTKSGVVLSVLKDHFPSKKSLIAELYDESKASMLKFVYGEVLELDAYEDLMRKVFHQSVIWGINNADLFNFMNQVQAHPYKWTEVTEEMIYPSVNKAILAKTTKAVKDGIIKDFPLDFTVHFMTGMHSSCVSYILSLNTVTEEEYNHLIEPMFQACWDAFKK